MVEYRLAGVEGSKPVSAEIVRRPAAAAASASASASAASASAAPGEYAVRIDGEERDLRILSMGPRGVEFVLGGRYHAARYRAASTARMEMVVDGVPVDLSMHSDLDEIVYKNSGGVGAAGDAGSDSLLRSPIPGKVVSFSAEEGHEVRKGDAVVVLESMKMQVAVKAHRDGVVKSLKVRQGGNVAKNDAIAEIE